MQNQLDLALRESERAKTETAHVSKSLGVVERENSRLRAQLSDLAMQVWFMNLNYRKYPWNILYSLLQFLCRSELY